MPGESAEAERLYVTVLVKDTGSWMRRAFLGFRKGDVFRLFDPAGTPVCLIDPVVGYPSECFTYAVASEDPRYHPEDDTYGVKTDWRIGTNDEALRV